MLCEARDILRLRRGHSVNEDLDGLAAQPLARRSPIGPPSPRS